MSDPDQILRRHFIAIATDEFDATGTFARLDVGKEVATLRGWLADERLGERRFEDAGFRSLAACPTYEDIRERLTGQQRFTDADAVVLYVTGHGLTDKGVHWIVLKDSAPDRLSSSAVATAELIRWLAEHRGLSNVFVIVDVCQAGGVLDELPAALLRDLPNEWIALLTTPAGVDAKVGAFSGVVEAVLAELECEPGAAADEGEPYLESHILTARLKRRLLSEHGQRLTILRDPYEPSVCLPNPRYDASRRQRVTTGPARRDLAILRQDMDAHWAHRAPVAPEHGAVFAGRTRLMSELIAFTEGPPGSLVLSGRAGSGKSAALARLVTCSDPVFRAEHAGLLAGARPLPPEGAVDVAVLATGKTAEQIAQQIGEALGVVEPPAGDLDAWVTGIAHATAARDRPVTVVVDALDEANDALAVALTLLERLNPRDAPRMRLLVGIRSSGSASDNIARSAGREPADLLVQALGAKTARADGDEFWDQEAIIDYVEQVLLHVRPNHPDSRSVAGVVARAAERSYLLAGLAARYLAAIDEPFAADDPRLGEVLARGVRELLLQDVEQSIGDGYQRTRALLLLRAAALAFGKGVPARTIWPLTATAIGEDDTQIGDGDVEWLLGHRIGGYLVRDTEDGLTVYRPFHDELRASLAEGGDYGLDPVAAHRRISRALEALAGWRWEEP